MPEMKIPISSLVLEEMYAYAYYAKKQQGSEIAGWGHYTPEKGIYKLAPLLPQTASGAEVNTFPDEILNDVKYDISDMIVQWHSHVNMSTKPSPTDKDLIKEALEIFPMLISIIVNCKGEYSARMDIKSVGSTSMRLNLSEPMTYDVELIVDYENEEIEKIVKEKLKPPPPAPVKTKEHKKGGSAYGYGFQGDLYDEWDNEDWRVPPVSNQEDRVFQAWLEKANLIVADYPEEYKLQEAKGVKGVWYLACVSLNILVMISKWGIDINGFAGFRWEDVLKRFGLYSQAKYHITIFDDYDNASYYMK